MPEEKKQDMWRSTITHEELSFPANESFFCSNNKKTKIENHFGKCLKIASELKNFEQKKLFWILMKKKIDKIFGKFWKVHRANILDLKKVNALDFGDF